VVWNALRDSEVTVDVGDARVFPCDLYGAKLTALPQTGKVTVQVGVEPMYLTVQG
jgi:hypothetical protein